MRRIYSMWEFWWIIIIIGRCKICKMSNFNCLNRIERFVRLRKPMIVEGKRNRSITMRAWNSIFLYIFFAFYIHGPIPLLLRCFVYHTKLHHPFVHNRDQLDRGIEMENPIDVAEILPFVSLHTTLRILRRANQ